MEGLTFSASHQGGSSELRSAPSASRPSTQTTQSTSVTGESAAQPQSSANEARPVLEVPRVEAYESSFQARLNYDRDKATVFVEILDPTTGDVIQRIPAESAAERIHELTGGYGGSVVDKIA